MRCYSVPYRKKKVMTLYNLFGGSHVQVRRQLGYVMNVMSVCWLPLVLLVVLARACPSFVTVGIISTRS